MAQDRGEGVPWHAVNDAREPVAPSKPAFPTTGTATVTPREVPGEDGDIIAPVAQPDGEEVHPTRAPQPWHRSADEVSQDTRHDPVRELGESAVRQASLSASGAIPVVAATRPAGTSAWTAEQSYVPSVLPEGADRDADRPASGDTNAADEAATAPTEGEGTPSATDAAHAPDQPEADPTGGDEGEPPVASAPDKEPTPWYRGVAFLTILGLLVLGGIAYAVYATVLREDDVEIAAPQVVEVPASPTVDPITLEDPTAFLSAMPATVGAYAMTDATPVEEDASGLGTRAAEIDDLTYSDGTTTLQLRAIQHYDADDATAQYSTLAEGGTDPQPVMVAGAEAGERVTLDGDPASYVWRNGTAVFVLSGPADALEDFWIQFPL